MKNVLLIIAAFIQSSFWQIDLVLLILLGILMYHESKQLLYVSFLIGLFLGFLLDINIGIFAIIFLVAAILAKVFKISPFSNNLFFGLIFSSIIILAQNLIKNSFGCVFSS